LESAGRLHDLQVVRFRPALDDRRQVGTHGARVFDDEYFQRPAFSAANTALPNAYPACERKISSPVMVSIGARCAALSPYRIPIVRLACMIGSATTSEGSSPPIRSISSSFAGVRRIL